METGGKFWLHFLEKTWKHTHTSLPILKIPLPAFFTTPSLTTTSLPHLISTTTPNLQRPSTISSQTATLLETNFAGAFPDTDHKPAEKPRPRLQLQHFYSFTTKQQSSTVRTAPAEISSGILPTASPSTTIPHQMGRYNNLYEARVLQSNGKRAREQRNEQEETRQGKANPEDPGNLCLRLRCESALLPRLAVPTRRPSYG